MPYFCYSVWKLIKLDIQCVHSDATKSKCIFKLEKISEIIHWFYITNILQSSYLFFQSKIFSKYKWIHTNSLGQYSDKLSLNQVENLHWNLENPQKKYFLMLRNSNAFLVFDYDEVVFRSLLKSGSFNFSNKIVLSDVWHLSAL